MAPAESFGPLERELGLLLRRSHAASGRLSRDLHPDIDPAAYELLALVASSPGVRASDLAAYIGVGRGTMSRQLSKLHATGLLARRPDPDDFRGQLLELTELGAQRLAAAQQARRARLREALRSWDQREVDELAEHLSRLNHVLGNPEG
ncbi:MarR family winged helix-turn-helix transcriptional regulator [Cellulomonas massiliensis]|uniref:MarR family winged helix-turn-helix transcriptional regulator n=1 Tax=Cellulomonas massiliensis TaxID=1465811 RepID=UPI000309DC2F|nr:MarR family winged helix-turn-helix transcriptional regulator [Cellulomonas massiliensis]